MIQRPQTAFALTAILMAVLTPFTALADRFANDPQAWWIYVLWASLLTASCSTLYGVMLYKDRPTQAVWFHRAFLFALPAAGMAWGLVLSMLVSGAPVESEWVGLVLVSILAASIWAARRGVLADEAKVRSMDRIR